MTRKLQCYIDRFEGNFAVLLLDEEQILFPRAFLPDYATQGDYLVLEINIDAGARKQAEHDIQKSRRRLIDEERER